MRKDHPVSQTTQSAAALQAEAPPEWCRVFCSLIPESIFVILEKPADFLCDLVVLDAPAQQEVNGKIKRARERSRNTLAIVSRCEQIMRG
jgi:hypothetical protein